jgi:hypothetical protein
MSPSQKPDIKTEVEPETIRWLEPGELRLERALGDVFRLTLDGDACYFRVAALRAFPHSTSNGFVQLFCVGQDGQRAESIGMLESVEGLSPENGALLAECLRESYLVPRIVCILEIEELRDLVRWSVETDRGECAFEMESVHDNLKLLGEARLIFRDTQDNRYEVPDVSALDKRSRNLLKHYL